MKINYAYGNSVKNFPEYNLGADPVTPSSVFACVNNSCQQVALEANQSQLGCKCNKPQKKVTCYQKCGETDVQVTGYKVNQGYFNPSEMPTSAQCTDGKSYITVNPSEYCGDGVTPYYYCNGSTCVTTKIPTNQGIYANCDDPATNTRRPSCKPSST